MLEFRNREYLRDQMNLKSLNLKRNFLQMSTETYSNQGLS